MKTNEKLTRLRIQAGLSQIELGEELGISRQTISKWEAGTTTPSYENLARLGQLYHVSVDSLLDDESKIQRMEEHKEKEQSGAIAEQPRKKVKTRTIFAVARAIILLVLMHVTMYVMFFKTEDDLIYQSQMDTMMVDVSTAIRFSME